MTTREEIAKIVCCGELGGCFFEGGAETGECLALAVHHDRTIDALMVLLSPPTDRPKLSPEVEYWLKPGALVPLEVTTISALIQEIQRLRGGHEHG